MGAPRIFAGTSGPVPEVRPISGASGFRVCSLSGFLGVDRGLSGFVGVYGDSRGFIGVCRVYRGSKGLSGFIGLCRGL